MGKCLSTKIIRWGRQKKKISSSSWVNLCIHASWNDGLVCVSLAWRMVFMHWSNINRRDDDLQGNSIFQNNAQPVYSFIDIGEGAKSTWMLQRMIHRMVWCRLGWVWVPAVSTGNKGKLRGLAQMSMWTPRAGCWHPNVLSGVLEPPGIDFPVFLHSHQVYSRQMKLLHCFERKLHTLWTIVSIHFMDYCFIVNIV